MRIPPNLRQKYIKEAIKNGLKLLIYDIETSHMIVRTFYIGHKVSIQHGQVKVPSKVITIQYKWAHEKKAHYFQWKRVSNIHKDGRDFDDSEMIRKFSEEVLSKADIVLGQNSDRFDFIVLNERAKALQLNILNQIASIDILKLSRKSFRSASHKLDYRSEQQGLGGKIPMRDSDWVDIEERGVSVTKKMVPYGLKDTTDTESLFYKELPYYKDLPAPATKVILLFARQPGSIACPKCAKKRQARYNTKVKGNNVICLNCGDQF